MTISAKIIADSVSPDGVRITTYELEYPRFIHSELMTHRAFSRNAASSRAIPIKRMIELIKEDTAMPIHWGKHQSGMQADEECNAYMNIGTPQHASREEAWLSARDKAIEIAEAFAEAGYHKQIVNRILEPFSHIKVVITATEFENWFYLRNHTDAQPEIKDLAGKMLVAKEASTPKELELGEWHVPYYKDGYWIECQSDETLYEAQMISVSCCAQVSYRRNDDSLEKAEKIYDRLVTSQPPHLSPTEHQGTPIDIDWVDNPPEGVTHLAHDKNELLHSWSGNLRGWIQYRQTIDVIVCGEQLELDL